MVSNATFNNIYIIMWSCPGNMPKYYPGLRDILPSPNMPKYYPGLRDILPDPKDILPGPDHINIIIILSV